MKHLSILLGLFCWAVQLSGQYYLTGSSYLQHFDQLASGLPKGWHVYTAATDSSMGVEQHLIPGTSSWGHSGGGFKNFASGGSVPPTTAAADQHLVTDRSLGVRQTSAAGYNPGAAFCFKIAHTVGLTDFQLQFELQTLTRSSHVIEWVVDYGIGDTPTVFTPVSVTGNRTTGNDTIVNHQIKADFGKQIDNLTDVIWIRIVNLSASAAGSGSRPSVGIDDFRLSWKGQARGSDRPDVLRTMPLTGEQFASPNLTPEFEFNRMVRKGMGNIYITNATKQLRDTLSVSDSRIVVDDYTVRISGWNWAHESEYYIGFDSAAFDTAGIRSFGIYDTMFWRFRIAPEVLTVDRLYETFDDACEQGVLPVGWSVINKKGNQQWGCHTAYGTTSYRITSYSGGKYHENEDWLISPKIHLPGNPDHIFFKQYKRRAGEELQLLWSEEYPGYGDPAAFNWNELRVESGAADTMVWLEHAQQFSYGLPQPFFIAFRYVSDQTTGYEIRIDSVVITEDASAVSELVSDRRLVLTGGFMGAPLELVISGSESERCYLEVFDISGKRVLGAEIRKQSGIYRYQINRGALAPGCYVVCLQRADGQRQVLRAMVW